MSNPGFKPIDAMDSDSKGVEEVIRPEAVLAHPIRGRVRSDAIAEDSVVDAGVAIPAAPPPPAPVVNVACPPEPPVAPPEPPVPAPPAPTDCR